MENVKKSKYRGLSLQFRVLLFLQGTLLPLVLACAGLILRVMIAPLMIVFNIIGFFWYLFLGTGILYGLFALTSLYLYY